MGIPSYFRSMLENYSDIIQTNLFPLNVDYFFLDFNSILYLSFQKVKDISSSNQKDFESQIISHAIQQLHDMIHSHIHPSKEIYVSMDGVAPMAKMIQQRSRRYKSILLHHYSEKESSWIPSHHISPGTRFLSQLDMELRNYKRQHSNGVKLVLNLSSIAGEGEHKFLSKIRALRYENESSSIVIYSPDGDLLTLSLLTHKSNIWIMRVPDLNSPVESIYQTPYLYCSMDKIQSHLSSTISILDYNLLLMLAGNDFVPSLPYLKIRSRGLDRLLRIYQSLIEHDSGFHLIDRESQLLNLDALLALFECLEKTESEDMKREWKRYRRDSLGLVDRHRELQERSMTASDIHMSRLQHLSFFHPDHPLFSQYGHLWKCISIDHPDWRDQFHSHFFTESPWTSSFQEEVVLNYVESIVFTWLYYTKQCPSYSWYYRFRIAPLPSDVVHVLRIHYRSWQSLIYQSFVKDTSRPFQPFEQLLYILPQTGRFLLPLNLQTKIVSHPQFYPPENTILLDALSGGKFIYSETLLPPLSMSMIQEWIQECSPQWTLKEKKRNSIHQRLC